MLIKSPYDFMKHNVEELLIAEQGIQIIVTTIRISRERTWIGFNITTAKDPLLSHENNQ